MSSSGLPRGRDLRRRWRALDWRTRERLGRLSGTGRWPSTQEEARLIAARSRRFRRYLVPSVTLRVVVIAAVTTFAVASGHLLVLILPAVLVPDTIVSSLGLPRVIRDDRTNRRVVREMESAGVDP